MTDWQPIETAPIDEYVLVYIPQQESLGLYGEPRIHEAWMCVAIQPKQGLWSRIMVYSDSDFDRDEDPTHWMPLPKEP